MSLSSAHIDKLWSYLARLSPDAAVTLIREIEAQRARGETEPIFELVLEAARHAVRDAGRKVPRMPTIVRLFCLPFEDLLTDGAGGPVRPGRVARASIMPIWTWLTQAQGNEGFARIAQEVERAMPAEGLEGPDELVRAFVSEAAATIERGFRASAVDHKLRARLEAGLGGPRALADARQMVAALKAAPAIAALRKALPAAIGSLTDNEITAAIKPIDAFLAVLPEHPELAFATLIARFHNPTQVLRLVARRAGTDSAARLAESPYAPAGELILYDFRLAAERAAEALASGQGVVTVLYELKRFHTFGEGIRAEIDIDPRSDWGTEVTTARRIASEPVDQEIRGLQRMVTAVFRPRQAASETDRAKLRPDPTGLKRAERVAVLTAGVRPLIEQLSVREALMGADRDVGQVLRLVSDSILDDIRRWPAELRPAAEEWLNAAARLTRILMGAETAEALDRAARAAARRQPARASA